MPNLEKGTKVAQTACNCCGKSVNVILNKNGGAYYFCPWPDDNGDPCNHHEKWGGKASRAMQQRYLDARKPKEPPQHEQPAAVDIDATRRRHPEPRPTPGVHEREDIDHDQRFWGG